MLPKKFFAWLTINRACNLRCKWCYAKFLKFDKKQDMGIETAGKSISLLKDLPLTDVVLIGGEPTIHPDFLRIVRMIKDAGLMPFVITNSIRFADDSFLRAALEAGILGITTSLKAGSDDLYKKFTGRKALSKITKAVENIKGTNIPHKISVTVHGGLFKHFDQVMDFIVKSGVESFALDMERPIVIDNETYMAGDFSLRDMADFFMGIYPKLKNCGVPFTIKVSIPFCLFRRGFIEELIKENKIISGCQIFGGSGIIIDPMGRLLPCNHFCDNPLGELGVDFKNAQEYLSFRQRSDVEDFYNTMADCPDKRCVDCADWMFCGGGCRMHWLYKRPEEIFEGR